MLGSWPPIPGAKGLPRVPDVQFRRSTRHTPLVHVSRAGLVAPGRHTPQCPPRRLCPALSRGFRCAAQKNSSVCGAAHTGSRLALPAPAMFLGRPPDGQRGLPRAGRFGRPGRRGAVLLAGACSRGTGPGRPWIVRKAAVSHSPGAGTPVWLGPTGLRRWLSETRFPMAQFRLAHARLGNPVPASRAATGRAAGPRCVAFSGWACVRAGHTDVRRRWGRVCRLLVFASRCSGGLRAAPLSPGDLHVDD